MVLNLPSATARDLQSNTVITNWPAELLSAYDQEALLTNSPVMGKLRSSTVPFFNDLSKEEDGSFGRQVEHRSGAVRTLQNDALRLFPTHDSSGARGGRDRDPFAPEEMLNCIISPRMSSTGWPRSARPTTGWSMP